MLPAMLKRAGDGTSARRQSAQPGQLGDKLAKRAKRPLLSGLLPEAAATYQSHSGPKSNRLDASAPRLAGHLEGLLTAPVHPVMQLGQHSGAQSSHMDPAAKRAHDLENHLNAPAQCTQQEVCQPDPALGGISIRCGAQLTCHRPSVSFGHLLRDSRLHQDPGNVRAQHERLNSSSDSPAGAGLSQVALASESPQLPDGHHAGNLRKSDPTNSEREAASRQGALKLVWQVKLRECVDASPVVLLQRKVLGSELSTRCAPYSEAVRARLTPSKAWQAPVTPVSSSL